MIHNNLDLFLQCGTLTSTDRTIQAEKFSLTDLNYRPLILLKVSEHLTLTLHTITLQKYINLNHTLRLVFMSLQRKYIHGAHIDSTVISSRISTKHEVRGLCKTDIFKSRNALHKKKVK